MNTINLFSQHIKALVESSKVKKKKDIVIEIFDQMHFDEMEDDLGSLGF